MSPIDGPLTEVLIPHPQSVPSIFIACKFTVPTETLYQVVKFPIWTGDDLSIVVLVFFVYIMFFLLLEYLYKFEQWILNLYFQ